MRYPLMQHITKGGSRRLEKSHEVWMMMMIAASWMWAGAAEKPEQSKMTFKNHRNDSKQLTQSITYHYNWVFSSVGWSFGRSSQSKISRSHFKLILCCFQPNISPQTKFDQNRMKNTEVEKIHYLSASVGRLGRSKNSRSHFKLILCCSLLNVVPLIKSYPNRMKNIVHKFKFSRFSTVKNV